MKKSKKKEDKSMKFLCLFVVIIAFTLAFVLLINKESDAYLHDIRINSHDFSPVVGEVIVARDMDAIYPKYYVVNVNEGEYSTYVYNYYETVSQYNLEFNRLIDDIVDYNAKDKMIRYLLGRGYGTYYELLNNLPEVVGSNNLKIY